MAYPPGRELNLGYVFFGNGHAKEFLPLIHDDIHSSIGHRQIFPPECSSTLASCGWRWPCQVSWRLFPAHYGGGWLRWLKSVYAGHTSTSEAELKVAQPSRSEPLLQLRWLASQRETLILSYPDQISQIRHGKSTISQPFSVTNLGNPDRVWSCPDFPNSSRKIQPQPAIFRDEFGKSWSCLILSRVGQFVTERRRTKRNSMGLDWLINYHVDHGLLT